MTFIRKDSETIRDVEQRLGQSVTILSEKRIEDPKRSLIDRADPEALGTTCYELSLKGSDGSEHTAVVRLNYDAFQVHGGGSHAGGVFYSGDRFQRNLKSMAMNLFSAIFPVGFGVDLVSSAVKIYDASQADDPTVRSMLLKSGIADGLKCAGTLAAILALYPLSPVLAMGVNAGARGALAALDLRDALAASGGAPIELLELRSGSPS